MHNAYHALDDYPLSEHYAACENYRQNVLRWESFSQRLSQKSVIFFDVSDALALFPHLELDAKYRLICYLSREYHGIWGRIVAIKRGNRRKPIVTPRSITDPLDADFELPDGATRPMLAIYHDGSPHGHLEALLSEKFLHAIPYTHFATDQWERCICQYPKDFQTNWTIYETLPDPRPHITTTPSGGMILSLCWYHSKGGPGASDGCDTIRLSQHTFFENLTRYLIHQSSKPTLHNPHISAANHYRPGRHRVLSTEQSILIATQNAL